MLNQDIEIFRRTHTQEIPAVIKCNQFFFHSFRFAKLVNRENKMKFV